MTIEESYCAVVELNQPNDGCEHHVPCQALLGGLSGELQYSDRFDRIVARELAGGRGLQAWSGLLRAHATLLRQLETDLERKIGLALADYDVLAQLALAGGSLRMTELADRALISRSGMTRRVARLVHEGLVSRAHADADARGVVVQLTNFGLDRLTVAAPVLWSRRLVRYRIKG